MNYLYILPPKYDSELGAKKQSIKKVLIVFKTNHVLTRGQFFY